MVNTLLVDLFDTIITLAVKPRDTLQKQLGVANPYEIEYIAQALCIRFPGMNSKEFIQRLVKKLNIRKSGYVVAIYHAWESTVKKAKFIDGALEALRTLRNLGYKLVLVSNTTPPTRDLIREIKIDQLFDSIILSCDVGFLKPNSQIFKIALKSVSASSGESCMVGNKWATDINGAVDFGLKGILIDEKINKPISHEKNSRIIAVVPSIRYVPSIISEINSKSRHQDNK